jgi:hypothetical protein
MLEEKMSSMPVGGAAQWERRYHPGAKRPETRISARQRVSALVLRTIFIAALVVVIVHVSMPQSASLWTAYDAPADLVRLVFGFAICVWLALQLFILPKDPGAYRTWLYLGLAAVPFVVICIVGIW